MRKNLFIAILLLVCFNSFSQARLGRSASYIKSEFSDEKYNLKYREVDSLKYIAIDTEFANVRYYINNDNVCYITTIVPDNEQTLNDMVQRYNKKYVIINSKKWMMYSSGGDCEIELIIFDKNEGYFFIWY